MSIENLDEVQSKFQRFQIHFIEKQSNHTTKHLQMVRQVVFTLVAMLCISTYTAVTYALLIESGTLFGSRSIRNAVRDNANVGRLSMKAVSSSSYYPPQRESRERKLRRLLEAKVRARFLDGVDLEKLRSNVTIMKEKLQYLTMLYTSTGKSIDTDDLAVALRDAIERSERRDPDIEYIKTLVALECAKKECRRESISQIKEEAKLVRQCIPRLNLQGLWIAESTLSKPLMINITYVGDTLLATTISIFGKLPKGELIFKADLSYMNALQPIALGKEVAEKLGREKLTLYPGKVQSYQSSTVRWVNGNFFMCRENVFGFLLPATNQHILFRRPKAKQIFQLIQYGIIKEKQLKQEYAYLERCYNLTYTQCQVDGSGITFRQLKSWSEEIE